MPAPTHHRWLLRATCLVSAALVVAPVRAEPESLRLDYAAPEGCPDEAAFVAEVLERTARVRFEPRSDEATAVVRISQVPPRSLGRLEIRTSEHATVRELDGSSCKEVVSALALILALTVDPNATTGPAAEPLPAIPVSPGPEVRPATSTPAASPPSPAPRAVDAAKRRTPDEIGWSAGVHGVLDAGVAPDLLWGGKAFFEVAGTHGLGWAARLSGSYAVTGDFETNSGAAAFSLGAARLEGCPAVIALGPSRTALCAGFEGGALRGKGLQGDRIAFPEEDTIGWFSVAAIARIQLKLKPILLEIEAAPAFPLVRRTFVFDNPRVVIHEIPPVVLSVSGGVGVQFW